METEEQGMNGRTRPVRIRSFLRGEAGLLAFLTVTGLVCNVGMTA